MTFQTRPWDDFHVHLRDPRQLGGMMEDVVPLIIPAVRRVGVMPNNRRQPILTIEDASEFQDKVLNARGSGQIFEPFIFMKVNEKTDPGQIRFCRQAGIIGLKWYAGDTTDSQAVSYRALRPIFAAASAANVPISIHGEVPERESIFPYASREEAFLPTLRQVIRDFPDLRIVMEHLSTAAAVGEIMVAGPNVAGSITLLHLLITSADLNNPHNRCLPPAREERDRSALVNAATSGSPKFFFGSDSAPHLLSAKLASPPANGAFSAPVLLKLIELFEQLDALEKLEPFVSEFGARFYGLPLNTGSVTFIKKPWVVPGFYPVGNDSLVPFLAGEIVLWQIG